MGKFTLALIGSIALVIAFIVGFALLVGTPVKAQSSGESEPDALSVCQTAAQVVRMAKFKNSGMPWHDAAVAVNLQEGDSVCFQFFAVQYQYGSSATKMLVGHEVYDVKEVLIQKFVVNNKLRFGPQLGYTLVLGRHFKI